MFRKQRISLLIIVFGLLIAIGTGLKAHFYHDVKNPDLSFTSNPKGSCNINGYTFTHTRETYSDGVIYTDSWWRTPRAPKVEMTAEAHGFGWAHVLFYGNIDGTKFGDSNNTTPEQLGSWVGFLPAAVGIDHTISATHTGSFNRNPKTYKWDVSGSIELVPYYWKWKLGGITGIGGSWEPAPSDFHTTQTVSTGGSWTVQRNWTTLNRPSPGSRPPSPPGSTPPDGGSGSEPPPDPLSNHPGCATDVLYDQCDNTGSCSEAESSGTGVASSRCGENGCCCYFWN
ncbi:MAG: hypothetical protein OXL96_11060 [Candidatus Poribacteria bacterium]|nr:hypothetical protein [Candidatus Poribacteria bacterium]